LDLLRALTVFMRVVEGGSFVAAGRVLNESPTAVTRQVAALEAHFGVRLLHRTTRHLSLTLDGTELLNHAHAMIEAAEAMEEGLGKRRRDPSGLVRMGCSVAFAQILQLRLQELLDRYPGLRLELMISDHLGDLVEGRLDLAVAVGERPETSLVARRLVEITRWLVAAPSYLARHGTPQRLAQLEIHECISHTDFLAQGGWTLNGPGGAENVRAEGRFAANNTESVHRAALAGWGIALLPSPSVRADIAAGTLQRVLPDYATVPQPTFLFYPSRRHLPPRTRAVIDFVVATTREIR
jgi:DNA-binding transcriptional LysR family regulator